MKWGERMIVIKKKASSSLLKAVAQAHGVSVEEVQSEMVATINLAWNNPNLEKQANFRRYFGNKAPTPEEFVRVMAKKVKH